MPERITAKLAILEEWSFIAFLISFPLTIRKVLFFIPVSGQFNEYTGIYLYLSDIFFVLLILSWIIALLRNNYYSLSTVIPQKYKENLWKRVYSHLIKDNKVAYISLLFILWAFLSFLWAESKSLSLFRSFKLLELLILAFYIKCRIVPRGTFIKKLSQIVIGIGVFNSAIGIWQFLTQKSIGLFWLKESLISQNIPGVAKIIFEGQKYIRAYGLFPHPNILGGFLVFSIILTLAYRKMFHACPIKSKCSTWNIWYLCGVEHRSLFYRIILTFQLIGLVLSFSKSAILGLIVALLCIYVPSRKECSTWNILRGGHGTFKMNQIYNWITGIIFTIIFIGSAYTSIFPIQMQTVKERGYLADVSRGTISDHWLLGVGNGNFVLDYYSSLPDLEAWRYQPVHNVFLLIWSELGIIGLFLFTLLLWKLFHPGSNVPRGTFDGAGVKQSDSIRTAITIRTFRSILVAFVFIMIFDHYFWDIQQGQLMLWMTIGSLL